jgi:phosphoglycerate dehydrogenase-like enzyme
MKLLLRQASEDRLRSVRERLGAGWSVQVVGVGDGPEAFAEALVDADAVVTMSWRAPYPRSERLRLIQLPGAGFDAVDFDAVPPSAAVCNVYEHEIGIAEFLLLAMLEWEIRLARMDADLRRGHWTGSFVADAPLHGELFGKTVGFVGYGRIARETARRLKSFGVRTLACTRTPSRGDGHVDAIAGMDGLHAMLARADFAVVTCPLSDQTRGLVDAAALDALGPGGVLLNVARGAVVDEDALWEAASGGRIAGAVIDTWYEYPPPGSDKGHPSKHPFAALDNVIMSPHASGWSAGLLDRRWAVMSENLERLARGDELLNVLKRPGEAPRC